MSQGNARTSGPEVKRRISDGRAIGVRIVPSQPVQIDLWMAKIIFGPHGISPRSGHAQQDLEFSYHASPQC